MKIFKTTWHHVRRSPYQALAAILIMMLTFLTISLFSFVVFASSVIINYFESKPQVTAFFKNEAKQTEIDSLIQNLKDSGQTAKIRFVSKQEALKIYKEQNKNDPILLDLVTADVLPASVEVSAVNINDLVSLSNILKGSPIVSEVVYQKDIVTTLTRWTNALRRIGIVIIAILALVSIFIMATIIGFRISQKREEIEIMRLLSATTWYVRWPFIFEGILYGLIGALLGWFIASATILYTIPLLKSFLQGIPLLPLPTLFFFLLLGGEVIVAILLGWFASFLAVLRYLK